MTGSKPNAQEIYQVLHKMIVDLEIAPSTRLTEQQLCDYFAVSRTPIRSALQHLENDGLITIKPKQGCFVRDIDLAEIHDYYDVRVSLESLVLAEIHKLSEPVGLNELAERWDPQARFYGSSATDELKHAEEAFHLELAAISGNRVLYRYMIDINEHIRVVRMFGWPDEQSVTDTYDEHWRICQALLRGELKSAQSDMAEHIRKSQGNASRVTLQQLHKNRGTDLLPAQYAKRSAGVLVGPAAEAP